MTEIKEMVAGWMDTKSTVTAIIRESKNHKKRLKQVEQEVEMRKKTHAQQAISGKEENIIAKNSSRV